MYIKKCGLTSCFIEPSYFPFVFQRESFPVELEVVARISDTTGTLLAGNLLDNQCLIGLIIGTLHHTTCVQFLEGCPKKM